MNEYLILPFIVVGAMIILVVLIQNAIISAKRCPDTSTALISDTQLPNGTVLGLVISGLLGLFLRLYGFDRSLWLDEFGTLWAVQGSMVQLLERVHAFHGQSPFYYSLVWLFINVLGESEITLRILSLILGIGTTFGSYLLGNFLFGKKTGLIAATFYWLSPAAVELESQARPYALALLMAVVMFYGFARAARDGDRCGRWLFVFGGAGLFLAQYVLSLAACGIALAYLFIGKLRLEYRIRQFAFDVIMQVVIALSCFAHVISLWNRRNSLTWLGAPNYLILYELIGPFFIIAIVPIILGLRTHGSAFEMTMVRVLWLSVIVQAGLLYLLAYVGTNLLHPRYMVVLIIPTIVIAAAALAKLPAHLTIAPLVYWLFFVAGVFLINFNSYGSFSGAGFQDWKTAIACLDQVVRQDPEVIVLYRSGFVEEDEWRKENLGSAVWAPLKTLMVHRVNLISLSYSWDKPGREDYFTRVVEPIVRRAPMFYFLTCAGCFNQATGQYPENLTAWIEGKFPRMFQKFTLRAGRGITLFQFVNKRSQLLPNKGEVVEQRKKSGDSSLSASQECKV